VDFSDFPFESFPKFTNRLGVEYRDVHLDFIMAVTVSSINWSVLYMGKTVNVEVKYMDVSSPAQILT
jgi:hypothetical protein